MAMSIVVRTRTLRPFGLRGLRKPGAVEFLRLSHATVPRYLGCTNRIHGDYGGVPKEAM